MGQNDIALGEKMTDPSINAGQGAGWSSRGPDYNWFDKSTLWGGLELRMPDNAASRGYYDYLKSEAGSVLSGSATVFNGDGNARVIPVTYDECSVYDDL